MRRADVHFLPCFALMLASLVPASQAAAPVQADAAPPKGEVKKYSFDHSKIFPGTVRDYWVYVPKQYDPARPACLYVNQDGLQYNAPAVFDQLIDKKEMPVTIGVFVMHGRVKAVSTQALDRFNRSLEYDGLGSDYGLRFANGITLSPDQSLLYVADYGSHWIFSYQVQPDGSLAHKQRYYHLHVPDTADDAGADGIRVDRDGRLYVTTKMGIQVCDQAGRVNCIIPTPNGRVANVCFGGPDFQTLFATCGDRVFKRKVKVKGANAYEAPTKPTAPRL